jgi:transposase-like protein
MAGTAKYPVNCPQCLISDRVVRKGLYAPAGDGFYRLVCRRCNVSFTRFISELATGAIAPDRPVKPNVNQGEKHPQAKLSEKQVRDIVTLADSGSSTIELADRYQVSKAAIVSILYGVTWSSVTGIIPKTQKLPARYKKRGR